jgi:hypothetical protein
MSDSSLCRLGLKLVEDEPGQHTYIHVCRVCQREYEPEFVVYHASTGIASDPLPLVTPEVCSVRSVTEVVWPPNGEVLGRSAVVHA